MSDSITKYDELMEEGKLNSSPSIQLYYYQTSTLGEDFEIKYN